MNAAARSDEHNAALIAVEVLCNKAERLQGINDQLVAALNECKLVLNAARISTKFHAPHVDVIISAALVAASA